MSAPPPQRRTPREELRHLPRDGAAIAWWRSAAPSATAGTMVLVHGLASNASRFAEFVEHTSLVPAWRVLRVDLRGHGGSQGFAPATLEDWCGDLVAVLDAEAAPDAVIVGHSLGAQVALYLAARQPSRVRALALIDPVFRDALAPLWRRRARAMPLVAGVAALVHALNRIGIRRRNVVPDDLRALDALAREALADPVREAAFIRRYSSTRGDLHQMHTAQYLQDLVQMFRPPPPLAPIVQPVLALLSTGATFAPREAMLARLAELPHCAVRTIECHHWPLTERPLAVREAIERWAATHAGPGVR